MEKQELQDQRIKVEKPGEDSTYPTKGEHSLC